ncbi:MAG: ABC transporter ATP-binding protein [Flavobacteriales bacterium]
MKSLFYLNKYLLKYKWLLVLGFVFILATNLFGIFMPKVVNSAIKELQSGLILLTGEERGNTTLQDAIIKASIWLAMLYIGLSVAKGIFLFFTRQTIIVMSRHIEYDLKNEIYDHYQKLSMGFYRKNNTGDLMNRISEDVSKVRMYLGPAIMYTANLAVLFVLTLIFMFNKNAELSLYVLLPLPILSVLIYYVSRVINQLSDKVQKQQSFLSTFVQEAFSGIRVLKAYNNQKPFAERFANESEIYKEVSMRLVRVNAFFMPIIIMLIGLSTLITVYAGGVYSAGGNDFDAGDIAEFIIYVNMLTWPFASVGWVTSLVQSAAASQNRINEFLNEKSDIVDGADDSERIKGKISFTNVSFVYPESGTEAIKNVSFEIKPGQTLAIIGRTGSGKSTIANLTCRHYDVSDGKILIDDKPIADYQLGSLRNNIGYVPQDVFLFSDSIKNNIALGINGDTDDASIYSAAKQADIYSNIMEFPNSFETLLGERGITLSGGQKQRVSIARAIVRQPQILIFDDCLSAVDTQTEKNILNNLKPLMAEKTTIIISHRISSVKHADLIIVMNEGEIAEMGSHAELIKQKGAYFELYELQASEIENPI